MDKIIMKIKYIFLLILISITVISCNTYTHQNVKNGRYLEPSGKFSIKLPRPLNDNTKITAQSKNDEGVISFTDQQESYLVRIDYTSISEKNKNEEEILEKFQLTCRDTYTACKLDPKLIFSELVPWKDQKIIFMNYIITMPVSMPDGSVDKSSWVFYRGTVSVVHNNHIYSISTQKKKTSNKDLIVSQEIKSELLNLLNSIEFNEMNLFSENLETHPHNNLKSGGYKLILIVPGNPSPVKLNVTLSVEGTNVSMKMEGEEEKLKARTDKGVFTASLNDNGQIINYVGPIDNKNNVSGAWKVTQNSRFLGQGKFRLEQQ